jgi:hypothetical protein
MGNQTDGNTNTLDAMAQEHKIVSVSVTFDLECQRT